jgi:hypothetical protein
MKEQQKNNPEIYPEADRGRLVRCSDTLARAPSTASDSLLQGASASGQALTAPQLGSLSIAEPNEQGSLGVTREPLSISTRIPEDC